MYNFYEYFGIEHDANIKTIILAYRNKISKYFIYNDLSDRQIYEIKMLKTGLYILTNKKLRKKYNKLIKIQNEIDINTTKKYQFDNNISNINIAPMYINKNASTNIEEIPKDDNPSDNKIYDSEQQTEMNHMFKTELQDIVVSEKYDSKKELINPNTISDRIFSLNNFRPTSNYSSDIENKLRMPYINPSKTKSNN